ncbi:hypothetical protein D4R51_03485, partial [bacterium]
PDLPIAPPGGGGAENGGENGSSSVQTATLSKISENPVFDFWVDPQTLEVYYLNPDGQVFSAKNGQDLQITQQKLNAPNFIKLSQNGQRVLMAFGDPRLPQWGIFDTIDKAWRPLPDGIMNATWGENSNTIIGFIKNGDNIGLSTINFSQNQPVYKTLAKDLRLQDVRLDFSSSSNLIAAETPSGSYPSRVWNINTKDLSVNQLFSAENGLIIRFSSNKDVMLTFSSGGGFKILNAKTLGLVTPVPFSTIPSKCSPDSAIIYCFVPSDENFKNASLPDDYLLKKFHTTDVLYRINTYTDEVTPVPIPQNAYGPIDAENPSLGGGHLYFVNRYDNSLYDLNLGSGD